MPPRLIDGVPPRYGAIEELGAEEASRRLTSTVREFLDPTERTIIAREEFERRCDVEINAWANAERERLGLDGMTIPAGVEQMGEMIAQRVREQVLAEFEIKDLYSPPRLQIRAAAGLGKTKVVIEELARREFWHGRNVEIYVPTTKLAMELKARIRANGLNACVIQGRRSESSDGPMCKKHKTEQKVVQLGLSVHSTLCKRTDAGGRELQCEFYDGCPYIAQWRNSEPAIRILVHNYLGVPRPHVERADRAEPDLVIIDESAFQTLTGNCSFTIDRLEARVRDALLASIDKRTDPRQALLSCEITAAFAKKHANQLWESLRTDVTPDMPEREARALLDEARQLEVHKRAHFWSRVAKEINFDRPFHGIEVCADDRVTTDDAQEHQHRIRVHWSLRPVIKRTTPLLMIDANADVEINRVFFGPSLESVEISASRNAHVAQCYSTRLTKRTLLGPHPKLAPEMTRELRKVIDIIEKEVGHGAKVFAVMPKQVRAYVTTADRENGSEHKRRLERSETWHGATIAHYQYLRGSNDWADNDTVIIVGREEPSPMQVERIARAIWADDPEPLRFIGKERYEQRRFGYRMRDGSLKGVMTSAHPDRRVQCVLKSIRENEMVQAIDRVRLVHAKERKRVLILCSIPLDITVDELRSFDELAGTPGRLGARGRLQLMLDVVGIAPLGERDLHRISAATLLNPFPSKSRAKDALKEARRLVRNDARATGTDENGGTNQIKYLFGIHPHLRAAKYRRAGQRGRSSLLLYDTRRRIAPPDVLSLFLMEPIDYFEDVPDIDDDEPPSA